MRKTKIEVKADFTAYADARKAAWLDVKDGRDNLSDMADNDGKAVIDFPNVELVEFDIQTQISLADNVCKTCHK